MAPAAAQLVDVALFALGSSCFALAALAALGGLCFLVAALALMPAARLRVV